jgi:DNA-binding PadR family transcriptional regulator
MDLLQGTLDMLVLRTLLLEPLHGYGIAKSIQNASNSLEIESARCIPPSNAWS